MALVPKKQVSAPVVSTPVVETQEEGTAVETMPVVPVAGSSTTTESKKRFLKEFKQKGKDRIARENQDEAIAAVRGSLSDKVKFLYPLGDPSTVGSRTEKGQSGIPTIRVIGYKLQALADIQVPVCKREGIPKKNLVGYSSVEWVTVKENEEFSVSLAELNLLVTKVEYEGLFTGDPEYPVEFQVSVNTVRSGVFGLTPRLELSRLSTTQDAQPIKSKISPVAVPKPGTEGKGIGDFEVLPEYEEKFGWIFEKSATPGRVDGGQSYSKVAPGSNAKALAAAMRDMMEGMQG